MIEEAVRKLTKGANWINGMFYTKKWHKNAKLGVPFSGTIKSIVLATP